MGVCPVIIMTSGGATKNSCPARGMYSASSTAK